MQHITFPRRLFPRCIAVVFGVSGCRVPVVITDTIDIGSEG